METVTRNSRKRRHRGAFSVSDDEESEDSPILAELKVDDSVLKKIIQRETLADVPTEDKLKIIQKELSKNESSVNGLTSDPSDEPFHYSTSASPIESSTPSVIQELSSFPVSTATSSPTHGSSIAAITPVIEPDVNLVAVPLVSSEIQTNTEQSSNKHRTNTEQTPNKISDKAVYSILDGLNTEQSSNKHRTSNYFTDSDSDFSSPQQNNAEAGQTVTLNTEQSSNKHRTNTEQTLKERRTNIEQSSNKHRTKGRTEYRTNTEQTPNNSSIKFSDVGRRFHSLVGLRRSIVLFIYSSCKSARSKTTDPIALTNLANSTAAARQTVEVTIRRLEKEGFLIKRESKMGKGGWTIYELPDSLYQEILHMEGLGKIYTNTEQSTNKVRTEHRTEHRTTLPSSSSILLDSIKLTTDREPSQPVSLPEAWNEINYDSLKSIGFKPVHLRQIFESGKADPEMVQESIYELDHDLRSGEKHGMRSPLLVLLKQLRVKGEPYTAVTPGYQSDELRYENKRLEELRRRQRELGEVKQEQSELLEEADRQRTDLQFQKWLITRTPDQKKSITQTFSSESKIGQSMLRAAYQKEIRNENETNL